eukprot:scaffold23321_cov35-Phaeocystis_antarctica.AAC.2
MLPSASSVRRAPPLVRVRVGMRVRVRVRVRVGVRARVRVRVRVSRRGGGCSREAVVEHHVDLGHKLCNIGSQAGVQALGTGVTGVQALLRTQGCEGAQGCSPGCMWFCEHHVDRHDGAVLTLYP